MSKKGFNENDDDLLVDLVNHYRVLYDQKHQDFRNVRAKNSAWRKIAEALKKDSNSCKRRWKDIRDNYWKIVRREKLPVGSAAPRSSRKWPLLKKLTFLGDYERDPPSYCAVSEPELRNIEVVLAEKDGPMELEQPLSVPVATASFSSTSESPPVSPSYPVHSSRRNPWSVVKKREEKELELLQSLVENKRTEDDIDLFMRSIALSVKKLPPHLINKAKIGILKYVTELSDCASHNIIIEGPSEIFDKIKINK
ncbi:unnamed protein product [Nezara viridula]|uniref:Transcription factor Adf-1 n=1 Tax=Nezara viridula TaxID=85310 RepID=A0A9P0HKS8_NEZVI|nr:unnamed protein product [Nezara viridula]